MRTILAGSAFSNFPNYNTVFQNFGELLLLTKAQIQLIAHMTAYSVTDGRSAETLRAFHKDVVDRM